MSDLPPPPPPPFDQPQAVGVAAGPSVVAAGLGWRLGALAIDLALQAGVAVGFALAFVNGINALPNDSGEQTGTTVGNPAVLLVLAIIVGLVWVIWTFVLWGWGKTPGKMILGLRVVDSSTGRSVGFGRMFLREFIGKGVIGMTLSGIPLVIGVLMILVVPNRRSYWDMIAKSVVVGSS